MSHPLYKIFGLCEIVFILDIILRFFVAKNVEGDESDFITHFEKIGISYLKGSFMFDFILMFPFGFILQNDLFHLIKSMRIQKFFKFFEPSFFGPYIRKFYGNKLRKVLLIEDKKNDINQSNNFIMERIRTRNYINSARI